MLEEMGVRVFWPETPPTSGPAEATDTVRAEPVDTAPPSPQLVRAAPVEGVREPSTTGAASGLQTDALDWDALRQSVTDWAAQRRRKPVFGTGDLRASWLVVGEPPMEDEERLGEPFAGDFGKLLDNMLAAVGASRRQGAYLTNLLKCRLPEDRSQEAAELADSLAFLRRQVQLVQPRIIVAMGRAAAQALLQTNEPPGKLRGRLHTWEGVPLLVTYHPLQLLRTPENKAHAWADLCLAQAALRANA